MSGTRSGSTLRLLAKPLWGILGFAALGACAELQAAGTATTDAAQNPSVGVQVAQASTKPTTPPAVSPLLQPAPEIFEASGRATWDGKRTLQGVWVAHPLAASARRVRIFNENTGTAVDGALFKRDANLQGTSVLISSEAAELLGLVVGEATPLRIVAVKPAEVRPEPQVDLTAEADDKTDQPIANEAVQKDEEPEAAESPEAVEDAEVAEKPAEEVKEDAATPATDEGKPEEEVAVASPTPKAKPEEKTQEEPAQAEKPEEPEKPEVQPEEERVFKFEQPPQPDPEEKPRQQAKAPATPKTSPLRQPFVQAGVFGVASNAEKLVQRLKRKGYPAKGVRVKSGGRTLTRVLAGPFQSTAERNQAQREIRRMGMKDAVPVRR